jgi:mono/diheme cytochrome c family protein
MGGASRVVRAAAVVLALSGAAACDHTIAGGRADGAAVYAEACARCHGSGGVPDSGLVARLGVKDLTDPSLQDRLTDAAIAEQILGGSKNQQMPAFAGVITTEQVKAVTSHVRSLRRAPLAP